MTQKVKMEKYKRPNAKNMQKKRKINGLNCKHFVEGTNEEDKKNTQIIKPFAS